MPSPAEWVQRLKSGGAKFDIAEPCSECGADLPRHPIAVGYCSCVEPGKVGVAIVCSEACRIHLFKRL